MRQLALHPERELVRLDHPFDGRVHLVVLQRRAVERLHQIELLALVGNGRFGLAMLLTLAWAMGSP